MKVSYWPKRYRYVVNEVSPWTETVINLSGQVKGRHSTTVQQGKQPQKDHGRPGNFNMGFPLLPPPPPILSYLSSPAPLLPYISP